MAAAVATERAAQAGEETEEECNESAEHQPVGISPSSIEAGVAHVVASDTEEDHLEDPSDKRYQERKRANEGHEDGPNTVVRGAAEPEEHREAGETGS